MNVQLEVSRSMGIGFCGLRIKPDLPWVADGDALVGASPSDDFIIRIWREGRRIRAALISLADMTIHPLVSRRPGDTPLLGGDVNAAADRLEAILAAEGQLGGEPWEWAGLTLPPVGPGVWVPGGVPDRWLTLIQMEGRRGRWLVGLDVDGFHIYQRHCGIPVRMPGSSRRLEFRSWIEAMAHCEAEDKDGPPWCYPDSADLGRMLAELLP